MDCPHCKSTRVFASRSQANTTLRWLFVTARCHTCLETFPVRSRLLGGPSLEERQQPSSKRESA